MIWLQWFDCVLNAPLMVTVASYSESISNKKRLFSVLTKETQHLFLRMAVPIKCMKKCNARNEKSSLVLEKPNRGNWMKWRHEYVDKA